MNGQTNSEERERRGGMCRSIIMRGRAAAAAGHGIRGEVADWYLPVSVVDEKRHGGSGVRVVVRMRRPGEWQ